MGDSMAKSKQTLDIVIKNTLENKDTIKIEKMNLKVLHVRPKNDTKNEKNVEKRLFEVFEKYEKDCKPLQKDV